MKNKRVLLLGGSRQQIPVIVKAKEMGYDVITCDYLPDNPGHAYADFYFNISTTDQEAVWKLAKEQQVDGVVCYASDPAAPAAAYAAEKLQLPTNPYQSVQILADKELFRNFLKEHHFATPLAHAYETFEDLCHDLQNFQLPVMVKPVDSSGSKGVSLYDGSLGTELELLKTQFEKALSFSRRKKVLIEEFVGSDGYQIAGDGFSVDGKLVFCQFGDDHFSKEARNPFVPIAASFPTVLSIEKQELIKAEIQRLFDLLHLKTGAYNFDIRFFQNKVYLMEVGPRNGGNYIPQLIQYSTGVDMVEATIEGALGVEVTFPKRTPEANEQRCCCYYALFAKQSGLLQKIEMDLNFQNEHLLEAHWYKKSGDQVEAYTGSDKALGILLLYFTNQKDMLDAISQMEQFITIKIEDGIVL